MALSSLLGLDSVEVLDMAAFKWTAECYDHIAIGCTDLPISKQWYSAVLGFEDYMQQEPTFKGDDLAFMRCVHCGCPVPNVYPSSYPSNAQFLDVRTLCVVTSNECLVSVVETSAPVPS